MNQRSSPPSSDKDGRKKPPLYRRFYRHWWTRRKIGQGEEFLQGRLDMQSAEIRATNANAEVAEAEAHLKDANTRSTHATAFKAELEVTQLACEFIDKQVGPKDPDSAFRLKSELIRNMIKNGSSRNHNDSSLSGPALSSGDGATGGNA